MLGHHHFAHVGQRPPQRPFAARNNPFHQVHLINGAFVIQTNFLQVVQQFFIGVPETVGRVLQQFPQRLLPVVQIGFVKIQCGVQTLRERLHVYVSRRQGCGSFVFRGCRFNRLHGRNAGRHCVAAFVPAVSFFQQSSVTSSGRFERNAFAPTAAFAGNFVFVFDGSRRQIRAGCTIQPSLIKHRFNVEMATDN